jgi:hypothetical protein
VGPFDAAWPGRSQYSQYSQNPRRSGGERARTEFCEYCEYCEEVHQGKRRRLWDRGTLRIERPPPRPATRIRAGPGIRCRDQLRSAGPFAIFAEFAEITVGIGRRRPPDRIQRIVRKLRRGSSREIRLVPSWGRPPEWASLLRSGARRRVRPGLRGHGGHRPARPIAVFAVSPPGWAACRRGPNSANIANCAKKLVKSAAVLEGSDPGRPRLADTPGGLPGQGSVRARSSPPRAIPSSRREWYRLEHPGDLNTRGSPVRFFSSRWAPTTGVLP